MVRLIHIHEIHALQIPWSQDHFERLVAKWVAACDQPFTAVITDEFCEMLQYAHHNTQNPLKIPSDGVVKSIITKMSTEMAEGLKKIFAVRFRVVIHRP